MNLAATAWSPNSSEWSARPYEPEAAVRQTWPMDLVKLTELMGPAPGSPLA